MLPSSPDSSAPAPAGSASVLRWWLIYGAVRTGTTFLLRLAAWHSKHYVSDWGLGRMLQLTPRDAHIRFDRARALRDISHNVLANAPRGSGRVLDLVFKQADLAGEDYQPLVEMWGPPQRTLFCFREPAACMASAIRKFPDVDLRELQQGYIRSFDVYRAVGGEPFEYHSGLGLDDYARLLAPLEVGSHFRFHYQGTSAPEHVTPEMHRAWEDFRRELAEAGRTRGASPDSGSTSS